MARPKKTQVIFSMTHLFELLETKYMIPSLKVIHLNIRELDNGELVFDRKLTSGPPESRDYGTKNSF